MRVHHIGYLVKKIEKAEQKFGLLGFSVVKEAVYDEYRRVNISFMEKDGYVIELVAPADKDSVVSELYKKIRNAPYHICYTAENFEKDLEELLSNGFVQIDEPCPAPAIGGKKVVFLMNAAIGMVELLEE